MKTLLTLFLALIGQLCLADDNLSKLTSKDVLSKLNKEDLVKVVFWLKPNLNHPHSTNPKLDPYYNPKWMVTISNNSKEDIVIDRWWFACSIWLNMTETKSGKEIATYSNFPPKEIIPVIIKKNESTEIVLGLHEYVSFESTFYDDRSEIANPGEYKVTHSRPIGKLF
jgi:hypothetical protein